MNGTNGSARRVRVERNIYQRPGGRFEVGYRDSAGRQRWRTVEGGITAARAARDDLLGRRGRGERVQPNPRLRFGEAADAWLAGQVADLRPATRAIYRNAIETHLRPRWGRRRLDAITVDDVAVLIRELRIEGKAEWTISGIVKAAGRVFAFARRRMSWHGENPVGELEDGERPKTSESTRRRIYLGDELAQTLAASSEPYRTLFALASVTGARLSECLGLVWADVRLHDLDSAEVRFEAQVDRAGMRQPLKTGESRRTVELPRQLGAMLVRLRLASADSTQRAFVFATRSGRALGQRNVMRALRRAQEQARDEQGRPTFPALHEQDDDGQAKHVPSGSVPSFHGFRHSAASDAIAAGESAEEVSWQLGHKSSVVTRAIYVQEIKTAERTALRRARMEARYGRVLEDAENLGTERGRGDVVSIGKRRTGTS